MLNFTRRGQLRHLIHSCLVASFALPVVVQAQTDPEVEEVVVTGSYIRNSAFAQNSPVDTVTQEDLFESGAPSMGAYIRDLSYTQNTNVVNIVLGSADGAQTGNSSFNLRGLGENSTLTLIDGARTLSPLMSASLPEIAIGRMEMVLDGGSALYGSDAVAGVVNIIPIKEFEGFRARTYYQRTEDGAMEDMTGSFLWGKTFDNGIAYVGAFEAQKKTPLMMYERTREWQHSNNASNEAPLVHSVSCVAPSQAYSCCNPMVEPVWGLCCWTRTVAHSTPASRRTGRARTPTRPGRSSTVPVPMSTVFSTPIRVTR